MPGPIYVPGATNTSRPGPTAPVYTVPRPSPGQAERNTTLRTTRQVRPYIPAIVSGSAQTGVSGVIDPPKRQPQANTNNRPTGSPGNNPYANIPAAQAAPQTPQQVVAQLNALVKSLGAGGPHVPAALTLQHIASLVNALPTHANYPGSLSLKNIQGALTPGKNTPGFVDPTAAANAAADAQYGGAISADRQNVAQMQAQNAQNLNDIQNWYNTMTSMAKSNAADDASGYQAAIQGTGNLGGAVSSALGFENGSAGADTIGQTGSILNAAARMAAASGAQADRNQLTATGLGGVQDYENQRNKGNVELAGLQNALGSDLKGRGNAFTTAKDAATQANTGNAQNYANSLAQIRNAYGSNFQNMLDAKKGKISSLADINSQLTSQSLNTAKMKLAGLSSAAAIMALPGQEAAGAAKTNLTNASAFKTYQDATSNWLKAQAAAFKAQHGTSGGSLGDTSLKATQARSSFAGKIATTIFQDPRVFNHDATTGQIALKNPKLAQREIMDMLANAKLDPKTRNLLFATTWDIIHG